MTSAILTSTELWEAAEADLERRAELVALATVVDVMIARQRAACDAALDDVVAAHARLDAAREDLLRVVELGEILARCA